MPRGAGDTKQYIKQIAYDANDNAEYVGEAPPGTATSDARWRIMKISYDGNNNATSILWANGESSKFTQIWDNRASLSYS